MHFSKVSVKCDRNLSVKKIGPSHLKVAKITKSWLGERKGFFLCPLSLAEELDELTFEINV